MNVYISQTMSMVMIVTKNKNINIYKIRVNLARVEKFIYIEQLFLTKMDKFINKSMSVVFIRFQNYKC